MNTTKLVLGFVNGTKYKEGVMGEGILGGGHNGRRVQWEDGKIRCTGRKA